ncbi:MAG: DUF58 domain-containing protein [Acidimicrobiia bacterium]
MALLDPATLGRLERLQLGTRRRLAGSIGGEHRSPNHGSTLDFADFRPYQPGDDFRRIDHLALARLDRLLIRLYEAEDDLTVRLLIDTSASMGGAVLHQAARAAAAIGFTALTRRDRVSVHTFPLHVPAPTFRGRGASAALFRHLESLEATGAGDFVGAARHLLGRPGPAGLTVLLSDLLTPDWQQGITRLPARGADLVVIHVLAAETLRPPLAGDLELVDQETGQTVAVSMSPATRRDYEALAQSWADDVARRCRSVGAAYVRVLDTDDLEALLVSAWRDAGVLR